MPWGKRNKKKKEPERIEAEEDLEEESEDESEDEIVVDKTKELGALKEELEQLKKQKTSGSQIPEIPKTWIVDEVPTQTQPVIRNQKTNEVYNIYSVLAEILNRTEE